MNGKRISLLAGTALLAGGLFAASISGAVAQTTPTPGAGQGPGLMQRWGGHGRMHGWHVRGQMGPYHDAMQAALAGALGMTVDDLQAELAAGKTVPQIAQERGVDLAKIREVMQAQHAAMGGPGHGPGFMWGPAGNGPADGTGPFCPWGSTGT